MGSQSTMSAASKVATKVAPKEDRHKTPLFNIAARGVKKDPPPLEAPPAPDPSTTSIDLRGGASNFAADLRRRRKKTRTNFGGDTGGFGGSTKLG